MTAFILGVAFFILLITLPRLPETCKFIKHDWEESDSVVEYDYTKGLIVHAKCRRCGIRDRLIYTGIFEYYPEGNNWRS